MKNRLMKFGRKAGLFGQEGQPAAVPSNRRVYAVGDIHGRMDLLKKIWTIIERDAALTNLHKIMIFVGDYVDRGRDSKGVIDFLINLNVRDGEVICLRGNHDQTLLDFLKDGNIYRAWKAFGAPETLLSYGVRPPQFDDPVDFERARTELVHNMPPAHVAFLETLRCSYAIGGYFFAHAGVKPGIPLADQDTQDLLWIRDQFLSSRQRLEKVVVHGHTPQTVAMRSADRIGIDTGAYATDRLSAVVLEGAECRFLST